MRDIKWQLDNPRHFVEANKGKEIEGSCLSFITFLVISQLAKVYYVCVYMQLFVDFNVTVYHVYLDTCVKHFSCWKLWHCVC